MPIPPPQVCPLDARDDDVTVMPAPDGCDWLFTCSAHNPPFTWTVTGVDPTLAGRDGITEQLGLYDDLPTCIHHDEPWVEYGIVEYRYKERYPEIYFNELLPRYGHTAEGPRQFSLSALVARTLGDLSREGLLEGRMGRATGYWSYNGTISYWAQPPRPPDVRQRTWMEFAMDAGLDPMKWDLVRAN